MESALYVLKPCFDWSVCVCLCGGRAGRWEVPEPPVKRRQALFIVLSVMSVLFGGAHGVGSFMLNGRKGSRKPSF